MITQLEAHVLVHLPINHRPVAWPEAYTYAEQALAGFDAGKKTVRKFISHLRHEGYIAINNGNVRMTAKGSYALAGYLMEKQP
jgi:hypothetical protein